MFKSILTALFLVFLSTTISQAATASLSWNANNPAEKVVDYKIYIGTETGVYGSPIQVGNTVSKSVTLEMICGKPVTYYFAVTALNMSGMESGYSNEVNKEVVMPPCAPDNLIISVTLGINVTPDGVEFALQGSPTTEIN